MTAFVIKADRPEGEQFSGEYPADETDREGVREGEEAEEGPEEESEHVGGEVDLGPSLVQPPWMRRDRERKRKRKRE
jgi:hypothetical protein